MATRTLLESAALPEPDAQALSSRVQAALGGAGGGDAGRDAPAPAAASPDDLLYEIAVDDGGNQVTRRFTESSLPEPVRQLVEWVDGRPERSFSLER